MTGLERRTPLRRQSKKRAAAARIYTKRRAAYLEANPWCAAWPWRYVTEAACDCSATEIHHKAGRVGSLLLDESRWVGLCRACHRWVTEHPRSAIGLGLSLSRLSGLPEDGAT